MQATRLHRQAWTPKGNEVAKQVVQPKKPSVSNNRLGVRVHSYGGYTTETKQSEYTWSRYGPETETREATGYDSSSGRIVDSSSNGGEHRNGHDSYRTSTHEQHNSSDGTSNYSNDSSSSSYTAYAGDVQEESAASSPASVIESNPLFTPEFVNALKSAINRNGEEALTSGPVSANSAPNRISVAEEVMHLAIKTAKTNVRALRAMQQQIDEVVNNEKKQVERLEYLLEKIQNENAYTRVLQGMVDEETDKQTAQPRMPWP